MLPELGNIGPMKAIISFDLQRKDSRGERTHCEPWRKRAALPR
jgi:hypothetical protein